MANALLHPLRVIDQGRRYKILEDVVGTQAFLHIPCGSVSWQPKDVEQRYCAFCGEFITDVLTL